MIAVSHVESSAPTPVSDVEAFEPNLILPLLGCLELLWSLRAGCYRSLLPEPTCAQQSMRPQQRSPDKECRQSRYSGRSRLNGARWRALNCYQS